MNNETRRVWAMIDEIDGLLERDPPDREYWLARRARWVRWLEETK